MHKTAMVIGGGVAGIQAALDLGDMGVETYLVERGPSIGGRMAQLDKTFPTNDCAMCILSPKLVETAGHPYIKIITLADILDLEGNPPHMRVKLRQRPRYVDAAKCTGCGMCVAKCPTNLPDPYNKGLSQAKAIRIPFPQAVPAIPVLDAAHCLYHRKGVCRLCEKACQMGAIDFTQQEKILEFEVGSVIVACGSEEFNARLKGEYGYGLFPNVMTSIEYERLLSASGPTGGHVVRPSDKREPTRIGILQCVGSRDSRSGNEHCSAVCCMQAAKDAIITQEHLPAARTTIFYMDVRAYGKGFDRFIDKARDAHHTRFICGRIASVESDPTTNDLRITYITEEGHRVVEDFDLLVLSVGLQPSADAMTTAQRLGVGLDTRGFLDVRTLSPVDTGRAGVFACGSVSGPKDIPESVMEASGAASAAAAMVGALSRKTVHVEQRAERDLRREPVRVGVFVCRCGINIAATVDVPGVVQYAATLPGVQYAGELLFTCAQDSQQVIRTAIEERKLNRVVVSACTPRTHEALFQKTLVSAGLNPYMFEFANIREHCSWVHQKEPAKATEKAKDLVRAAVAKVALAEPLHRAELGVNQNALVIGGGLAGMTAALDLAEQGFGVHLVEKEPVLGGNLRHVHTTLYGEETAGTLASVIARVTAHPRVTIHLNAAIRTLAGYVGNFKTTLSAPGGGPDAEFAHGAVIVATGASERQPAEYLYGRDERIVTQRQLEAMLKDGASAAAPVDLAQARSIVMIQCVGSRNDERPYCSRVCCSNALKNAIACKARNPKVAVYVLFRDIRSYGLRERQYRRARELGVVFVRYDADHPPVVRLEGRDLSVSVEDKILGKTLTAKPDLLVLSTGMTPNPDNKALSQFLKVPLGPEGYFLEAHVKLRPVDFATDGVFVCGLAHYPKDLGETIAQARAAAGRAATILSKDKIESEGRIARIREDLCSGCGVCVAVCPFKAVELDPARNVAVVNAALCKGCGVCTASCLANAADLCGFKNEQILEMLATL